MAFDLFSPSRLVNTMAAQLAVSVGKIGHVVNVIGPVQGDGLGLSAGEACAAGSKHEQSAAEKQRQELHGTGILQDRSLGVKIVRIQWTGGAEP